MLRNDVRISVVIHETRCILPISEGYKSYGNQYLTISCADQVFTTPKYNSLSTAQYNYICEFHLSTTLEDTIWQLVDISAYTKTTLSSYLIGKIGININTIITSFHRECRKIWVPLTPAYGVGSDLFVEKDQNINSGEVCLSISVYFNQDNVLDKPAGSVLSHLDFSKTKVVVLDLYKLADLVELNLFSLNKNEYFVEISHAEYTFRSEVKTLMTTSDFNHRLYIPYGANNCDHYIRFKIFTGGQVPFFIARYAYSLDQIIKGNDQQPFWINFYSQPVQSGILSDQFEAIKNIDMQKVLINSVGVYNTLTNKLLVPIENNITNTLTYKSEQSSFIVFPTDKPAFTTLLSLSSGVNKTPDMFLFSFRYCGRLKINIMLKSKHTSQLFEISDIALQPSSQMTRVIITADLFNFKLDPNLYHSVTVVINIGKDVFSMQYPVSIDKITSNPMTIFLENLNSMWDIGIMLNLNNSIFAYHLMKRSDFIENLGIPTVVKFYTFPYTGQSFTGLIRFLFNDASYSILPVSVATRLCKNTDEISNSVRYVLRCYIFDGFDLQPQTAVLKSDEAFLPDIYVLIEFAETTLMSSVIMNTTHPQCFESLETELDISIVSFNKSYVTIKIFQSSALIQDELIGRATFNLKDMPKTWTGPPVALELYRNLSEDSGLSSYKGHIRVAFELIPLSDIASYPFFSDIKPKTENAVLYLNFFSVLTYRECDLKNTSIFYSYLDGSNENIKWTSSLSNPLKIFHNIALYRDNYKICLNIPISTLFTAPLFVFFTCATGYYYTIIDMTNHCQNDGLLNRNIGNFNLKHQLILDELHMSSMIASKSRTLTDSSAESDRLLLVDKFNYSKPRDQTVVTYKASTVKTPIERQFFVDEGNINLLTRAQAYNFIKESSNTSLVIMQNYKLNDDVDVYGYKPECLLFSLHNQNNKVESEDLIKETLNYCLDDFLLDDDVQRFYIYEVRPKAFPRRAGVLSCQIQLLKPKETPTPKHMKIPNIELEIRFYVLNIKFVDELAQSEAGTYYMKIRIPNKSKPKMDTTNISTFGVFNKLLLLSVHLPQESLAEVELVSVSNGVETVIGTDYIDLFSRWLSYRFHELASANLLPIETRPFYSENCTYVQCHYRLWIEMYDKSQSVNIPTHHLSRVEPLNYELRVCLYDVTNLINLDGSHIQVNISMSTESNYINEQLSDVHYNIKNATASFNWRYLIPLAIPSNSNTIIMRIYTVNMFGLSPVLTCEGQLDIAESLIVIKSLKHNDTYSSGPLTIKCFDRNRDDCGLGHISFTIVSAKTAQVAPVGLGRSEPNRFPYLEPVFTNRAYITWDSVSSSIVQYSEQLYKNNMKAIITIVITIVLVIIVALIVLIKR